VQQIFDAIKNVEGVEDGEKVKSIFRDQKIPDEVIEVACWDIMVRLLIISIQLYSLTPLLQKKLLMYAIKMYIQAYDVIAQDEGFPRVWSACSCAPQDKV
jgi:hypothetical protein